MAGRDVSSLARPCRRPAGTATANGPRTSNGSPCTTARSPLAELGRPRRHRSRPPPAPAPPPPRLRLRARVIEATAPDPSTLDTYHRMLVDHTYEVESVLEGSLDAKKIAVLHWAVLDDRAVPGFPRTVGQRGRARPRTPCRPSRASGRTDRSGIRGLQSANVPRRRHPCGPAAGPAMIILGRIPGGSRSVADRFTIKAS